jgi:hypothetical protein
MDDCYSQGYKPIFVGQGEQANQDWLGDPAFAKSGASITGFLFTNTSTPAIAAYDEAMKEYFPSANKVVPLVTTTVWNAMVILGQGAANAHVGDNATPAQEIAGLNMITNDNHGGLTPPLTYANGGNTQLGGCTFSVITAGSQYQLAHNGQPGCITNTQAAGYYAALGQK